jgi:hypothetical protein
MSEDLLAAEVDALLRCAPDSWTATPCDARYVVDMLTVAGFVERRITYTVHLPGEAKPERITIDCTGECGLATLMEVVPDYWAWWGQRWHALQQPRGEPRTPLVTRDSDEWRLTDFGRAAQEALKHGDRWPIDVVLLHGGITGTPQQHPAGRTTEPAPVGGSGRPVHGTTGSLTVSVLNWSAGAKALAKVLVNFLTNVVAVEPRAYRRRPWPGANSWTNWGLGLDDTGTWYLFHFRREGTPRWVPHPHADLRIPSGWLDSVARRFVEDGEVAAETRNGQPMRHYISRLRKVILKAVHGEGICPEGNPILFDYEHQAYRPVIRFGRVTRTASGGLVFTPTAPT